MGIGPIVSVGGLSTTGSPFRWTYAGGSMVNMLAAPKRDLLAALAVNELAEMVEDPTARSRMTEAATEAMHAAVDRIAHRH